MRLDVRTGLRVVVALTVITVMFAFVGWRFTGSARDVEDLQLVQLHAPLALITATLVMLAVAALGLSWATLLTSMRGVPAGSGRSRLVAIFCFTWLGRYVPGTLPFLASRVYVASRVGYGVRVPSVATGFQSVLEVITASMFGVVALTIARGGEHPATWIALATAGFLLLCIVQRNSLVTLSRLGRRITERLPVLSDSRLPSTGAITASTGCVLASQALMSASVIATSAMMTDVSVSEMPAIAAATSLAGVAGVLFVFAPAGFGVRDGVLTALLSTVMPLEAAASVAIAHRALTMASDVILAVLALAADRIRAWLSATEQRLPVPVEQRA
jgi:uncharacterized membrane protein YbhN (UPF0104 family)